MRDGDGKNACIAHHERYAGRNRDGLSFRFGRTGQRAKRRVHDVRKPRREHIERRLLGEHRQRRLTTHGDGAQVVDPVDMIGVFVRVEHRVDSADPGGHQLQTQFGRRIDE
jgi:hypothetical protein